MWLVLQPFMVVLPFGARYLEGELVVFGALLAFGAQAALPRERVEYLRQLPFPRREVARSMHVAAMIVLATTSLADYVGNVCGLAPCAWQRVFSWSSDRQRLLEPHFERALWLNLYGLPFLSYWVAVTVLQRRRSQSREMLPHVSWLVLVGAVVLWPVVFVGGATDPHETPVFDVWWRNVPGALAALGAWWLSRRALARADRLGIDAFPQEELSWES